MGIVYDYLLNALRTSDFTQPSTGVVSFFIGSWDASSGAYPTVGSGAGNAVVKGNMWNISVAGTLPTAVVVEVGDALMALTDSPGQTEANWMVLQANVGYTAGYLNIPQNSQSADYTTVLADASKQIFHPATDTNSRIFTIDSNANVPYEIGTAITFINMSANSCTIAITSDTLYLAGTGSTGSRTLSQYGVVTAVKITSTSWIINGTGLT